MRLDLRIAITAMTCFVSASLVSSALPPGYTGKPFKGDTLLGKPQQIPGVVKAVFWDSGGEGISWHTGLTAQGYSGNDYDVIGYGTNGHFDSSVNATHPTAHLGWIASDAPNANPPLIGQWLKYTVNVNKAGVYAIDFKQATAIAPPNLQALTFYNGTWSRTDSVKDLPMCSTPPGCPEVWHAWTCNMDVDTVSLDTGLQVVQITFHVGSWNFDWMRFRLKTGTITHIPVQLASQAGAMDLRIALSGARLTFSYNAGATAPARISIVDCAGKTVLSSSDEMSAVGRRTVNLDMHNLRKGAYFVTIECNGSRATKAVTIVR
jgi:hypothetical protein